MKADRYVKLNSVGCMLDLKTGYVFPILTLPEDNIDDFTSVHLKDCSYEWIESLKGIDKVYVGVWFKNNG